MNPLSFGNAKIFGLSLFLVLYFLILLNLETSAEYENVHKFLLISLISVSYLPFKSSLLIVFLLRFKIKAIWLISTSHSQFTISQPWLVDPNIGFKIGLLPIKSNVAKKVGFLKKIGKVYMYINIHI